jgi:Flp pilus assembly protein TadD
MLGVAYYFSRDSDMAIKQMQSVLKLNPDFHRASYWLGRTYVLKKMFEEAEVEFQRSIDRSYGNPEYVAALGYAYAEAGKGDKAENSLEQLNVLSKETIVSALDLAMIYAALGEREQALDYIEKGIEQEEENVGRINVNPAFDPLRSEPRFTEIVKRIRLEN